MTLLELIRDVRRLTRDFSNSVFREEDIISFLNNGINRIKQVIPSLVGMKKLSAKTDVVILLPDMYEDLLPIYATSRCFMQDENFYQATTYMNEFEQKLSELLSKIENGEIVIMDANGNAIGTSLEMDSVTDVYFKKVYSDDELLDDEVI